MQATIPPGVISPALLTAEDQKLLANLTGLFEPQLSRFVYRLQEELGWHQHMLRNRKKTTYSFKEANRLLSRTSSYAQALARTLQGIPNIEFLLVPWVEILEGRYEGPDRPAVARAGLAYFVSRLEKVREEVDERLRNPEAVCTLFDMVPGKSRRTSPHKRLWMHLFELWELSGNPVDYSQRLEAFVCLCHRIIGEASPKSGTIKGAIAERQKHPEKWRLGLRLEC